MDMSLNLGTLDQISYRIDQEVNQSLGVMREIVDYDDILEPSTIQRFNEVIREVEARLNTDTLSVVVVGEQKAGKSTFLNAILGEEVLGTAVKECTATVTFIQYGDQPHYTAFKTDGTELVFRSPFHERLVVVTENLERLERTYGFASHEFPSVSPNAKERVKSTRARTLRELQEIAQALQNLGLSDAILEDLRRKHPNVLKKWQADVAHAREIYSMQEEKLATFPESADLSERLRRYEASALSAAEQREHHKADALSVLEQTIPSFLQEEQKSWLDTLLLFLFGWLYAKEKKQRTILREDVDRSRKEVEILEAQEQLEQLARLYGVPVPRFLTGRADDAPKLREKADPEVRRLLQRREERKQELDHANYEWEKIHGAERYIALMGEQKTLTDELLPAFKKDVHNLTDMQKQGNDIAELYIQFPAKHLPPNVQIIDTPGVNTSTKTNQDRAWKAIRQYGDACLLVSDINQVVSQSTRDFLDKVKPIIPHILLVLAKVDVAYERAEEDSLILGTGEDPWEQVNQARDVGVKRFAEQAGRSTEDVFAFTVAAEPALRKVAGPGNLGHAFADEMEKLFDVLNAEKAVALATRAARGIQNCVAEVQTAQESVSEELGERLDFLESQRLPDPESFRESKIQMIHQVAPEGAYHVISEAFNFVAESVNAKIEQFSHEIYSCQNAEQVEAVVKRYPDARAIFINDCLHSISEFSRQTMVDGMEDLHAQIVHDIKERFWLVEEQMGENVVSLEFPTIDIGNVSVALTYEDLHLETMVGDSEFMRIAGGVGGAAVGAAIGTVIFPVIGTAIGSALGVMAAEAFGGIRSLQAKCVRKVAEDLHNLQHKMLHALETDVQTLIMNELIRVLWTNLQQTMDSFGQWIDEAIRDEQWLIESTQTELETLQEHRTLLAQNSQNILSLQKKAARISKGVVES